MKYQSAMAKIMTGAYKYSRIDWPSFFMFVILLIYWLDGCGLIPVPTKLTPIITNAVAIVTK